MDYKIMALDLDGTLTNSKKELTPRTKQVLIAAQQNGLRLILASGRPTYGITPLAKELQLDLYGGYILAFNGGQIVDCKTEQVLFEKKLTPQQIPYLYQQALQNNATILSYDKEVIITENPESIYALKEAFLTKMPIKQVASFLDALPTSIPKCMIVGDPALLLALEIEMKAALEGQMEVYRSEPFFLELLPLGIDKAQSLHLLLNKLGLQASQLIAVGDGYNDLSMIQYAGLGVAMENAQEAVKEAANYITASNEADGVALVIEKFYNPYNQ